MKLGMNSSIENFGIISCSFITDKNIDSNVVSIYSILRCMNYCNVFGGSVFTFQVLYDLLNVNSKKSAQTKVVKDSIKWLIDNEYITLHHYLTDDIVSVETATDMFLITFNEEKIDDKGFVKIPQHNIKLLLNCIKDNTGHGFNKYKFIRYYLIIARRCSNVEKFGFITMKNFNNLLGVSEITCSSWNKILEDAGIIYINNDYGYIVNGECRMGCTMVAHRNITLSDVENRFMNEETFKYLIKHHTSNKKSIKLIDKESSNNKRSESMKKVWANRKSGL